MPASSSPSSRPSPTSGATTAVEPLVRAAQPAAETLARAAQPAAEKLARAAQPAAETLARAAQPAVEPLVRAADAVAAAAGPVTAPPHVAVRRGRGASVVMLGSLAGFGLLFWLVRTNRSQAFDLAMTLRFQRRRRPWLDRVMTVASWPGFPPQSRVIPPALMTLLVAARLRTEAAFLLLAWASATVSTVLKSVTRRARPAAGPDLRVVVAPLGGSSFPSGHVLTFVGTYGFTAYLAATLIRSDAARATTAGSLIALVLLVGPSRIYQGHHWATDVTASYLVGTAYLIAVVTVYRRVKESQLPAAQRPSA